MPIVGGQSYVDGMDPLTPDAYLRHLDHDSARFRTVLADVDPTTRVPGCPDWDAGDLLWHLAEVQWFWAVVIETRPAGPPDEHPARPSTYDELLTTYAGCSARLLTALSEADPAEEAWHWSADHRVGTSYRRQAHEALIHRIDAEQTAGVDSAVDSALAADGVDEALFIMYGGQAPDWAAIEPAGGAVAIRLTDTHTTLWARPGTLTGTDPDSGTSYDEGFLEPADDPGGPAAATVSGTSVDVDAWLWHRRDDSVIDLAGDAAVLEVFRAAVGQAIV